jgi:hypothetical protein
MVKFVVMMWIIQSITSESMWISQIIVGLFDTNNQFFPNLLILVKERQTVVRIPLSETKVAR